MTANATGRGPDIVIAGSARSATSALARALSVHPDIDPGKVKEPNFFSRHFERGFEWYDGFYDSRRSDLLRLDASVSYTSPLYPAALENLAMTSPDPFIIYCVRDPIDRAVSHYLYRRHYFKIEPAESFGSALSESSYYLLSSDYAAWLTALTSHFPRLLVVPFEAVTGGSHAVATVICRQVGLGEPPADEQQVQRHRNDVMEYRNDVFRRASKVLRHSAWNPRLRSALGASRVRRLRGIVTRKPALPTLAEALASCNADQLVELAELRERAMTAVDDRLKDQDERLGLSWQRLCFATREAGPA